VLFDGTVNPTKLMPLMKPISFSLFLKFLCAISVLLMQSVVFAQPIEPKVLQKWLAEPTLERFNTNEVTELQRFYSARDYQPVWIAPEPESSPLDSALAFIANAEAEGLDSRDYQLEQLQLLQRQSQIDEFAHSTVELELRTTQSLLMLAHDLARGRLSATAADADWHIPQPSFDAVPFLLKAAATDNIPQSLNELTQKKPSYQSLKQKLARYRELANNHTGWTQIPNISLIRPGATHEVIPLVRKRMAEAYIIDGFAEYNLAYNTSLYYDEELVAAIKVFQAQHGLNTDGIIGKNTLQALNTTLDWKIRQLRINMERLRWLPRNLGERYLLVNLAGFWLAAAEHGEHVLNMRIIVGRDYRSTPSFSSQVSHMIVNPYWNIPASIARKDLLPKQQKDPDYFTTANIKVYPNYNYEAEPLDPATIDWHAIKKGFKGFPYVLRQDPGENNALGSIKFMFPNPFSIYMHDTPSKSLFQKDIRTFSSGCIRLEKPLKLAAFILGDQNISTEFTAELNNGETATINLPQQLPIYLVYITTWVDKLNKVHFSPDIYGRDMRALRYAGW
jgi:L,D-transpeptidase YcbB